jgi:Cytochrome c554 and c-prime
MHRSAWNAAARSSTRHARSHSIIAVTALAACLLPAIVVLGQAPPSADSPRTTRDRVNSQRWWPTKGTVPFADFAGTSACGECHAKKASSQLTTPMAQAAVRLAQRASSPEIFPGTVQLGPYLYRISSGGIGSRLEVSFGKQSILASIAWIFGAGVHGQTYILEHDGAFYESQVSRFAALHGMDLTPGHTRASTDNLKNALGEQLSNSAAARCFACHTTYATTDSKFDASRAVPGIHCEQCHGPGAQHIHAIHADQRKEALRTILNPANLGPMESVDFCGACHRTTLDVVESTEAYGPINVRFQPYRLQKSRCWGTEGDARLTCIACHNPHEPLVHSASFYDERCLACHAARGSESAGGDLAPAVCPVGTANCTSCHMPKSDVPEMHAQFTDHFIRIVRAGEKYPN